VKALYKQTLVPLDGSIFAESVFKQFLHRRGHIGEPDDIAFGILFLASDESKFVTGSELAIDGGYTAR